MLQNMKTSRKELMVNVYHVREKVEHTSFTPVVMSATGGLAHEATFFYKLLASLR